MPWRRSLLTACQIRAARAMLRWSVDQLARECKIGTKTVWRLEKGFGIPQGVNTETLQRLRKCFEDQGFVFLPDDGTGRGGPGLRFNTYPGRDGNSVK